MGRGGVCTGGEVDTGLHSVAPVACLQGAAVCMLPLPELLLALLVLLLLRRPLL